MRINLGSGKSFDPRYVNIDIESHARPDIVCDISSGDVIGSSFATARFGELSLQESAYEEIRCYDVLEHIPQLTRAMTNCLRLLCLGGLMDIKVPYDLSYGAWQDPTHVRAFNERSWLYYTDWFWYLGWTQHRFQLSKLKFNMSPLGQELRATGSRDEDLIRTPRAVDSMHVVLQKVSLSAAERQLASSAFSRDS